MSGVPLRRVPEEVAADLSSVGEHRGVVEEGLVADLHLEELLVTRGQLLGPRAQREQQPQQPQGQGRHPGRQEAAGQ